MAEKRMFSMKIVDSDAFLDMPQSSQNLYFHLNMRADDDGFVGNPKKIMRMIGASEDDYKVLIFKRFILTFENSVCVIKHWFIHNTLRADRKLETQYEEVKQLQLKENKAYTLMSDSCQADVSIDIDKIRLDIDKNSICIEPIGSAKKSSFLSPEKNLHKKEINTPLPPSLEIGSEYVDKYGDSMINDFSLYRNELNTTKTRRRYHSEKFFDISRRLTTRHSRNFNSKESNGNSKRQNVSYKRQVGNSLTNSHGKDYTAGAKELGIEVVNGDGGR